MRYGRPRLLPFSVLQPLLNFLKWHLYIQFLGCSVSYCPLTSILFFSLKFKLSLSYIKNGAAAFHWGADLPGIHWTRVCVGKCPGWFCSSCRFPWPSPRRSSWTFWIKCVCEWTITSWRTTQWPSRSISGDTLRERETKYTKNIKSSSFILMPSNLWNSR